MSTDKPRVSARPSQNTGCCNHLQQNFAQKAPNLVWASDITYIKAGGKWHYLCMVINAPYGLMFHSDQGTQYTASTFRQLLDSLHVVQSFSKKGYPFDNACCECFFKYLKKEETNRKSYPSLKELQLSIFEYIEGHYNSKRPHSTLGMLTPNEAETLYWKQKV